MTDADGLARFFMVDERKADGLPPNYNVAPTDRVYAVTEYRDERLLVSFQWGLVPSWAGDPRVGNRHINARAETVADKPAFKAAFQRRRCLIPADGFYEWQEREQGKVPHFIHAAGGTPLALAGLWELWRDPEDLEGEPLLTCTIITTEASPELKELHERMPVMLEPKHWEPWLDSDFDDREALRRLLVATDHVPLSYHPVSQRVNSVRNNSPDLLRPTDVV